MNNKYETLYKDSKYKLVDQNGAGYHFIVMENNKIITKVWFAELSKYDNKYAMVDDGIAIGYIRINELPERLCSELSNISSGEFDLPLEGVENVN